MPVYTVFKPGGNTDDEFQKYVELLEEIGIDVTRAPRIPEPGTNRRWLYAWRNRSQADRFARELRSRLRDPDWDVHEFQSAPEEEGPIAPLEILAFPSSDGIAFQLDSNSQARVVRHFPNARLAGETFMSSQTWTEFQTQFAGWGDQLAALLTGIPIGHVRELGGYRVTDRNGRVIEEDVMLDNVAG